MKDPHEIGLKGRLPIIIENSLNSFGQRSLLPQSTGGGCPTR